MNTIRTIIIEDNQCNARAIRKVIESHFPEIELLTTVTCIKDGVQQINQYKPDLLIMDIHLSDGSSFDILQLCTFTDFKIVFMSAYHEYAVKALQLSAVDFILKPFDINELVIAIDKAIDEINDKDYQIKINTLLNNINDQTNKVILQNQEAIKVCDINNIVWAEAIVGGANFYFLRSEPFYVNKPLRRYETILSGYAFVRCHPHYLVNMTHVQEINTDKHYLILSNGDHLDYEPRKNTVIQSFFNQNKRFVATF